MESLNIYTIAMYYTWSNSGFTHTNPRRPNKIYEYHPEADRSLLLDGAATEPDPGSRALERLATGDVGAHR